MKKYFFRLINLRHDELLCTVSVLTPKIIEEICETHRITFEDIEVEIFENEE